MCCFMKIYKKEWIFDVLNSKVCIYMLRFLKFKGYRKEWCLKLKVMIFFNLYYLYFNSSC